MDYLMLEISTHFNLIPAIGTETARNSDIKFPTSGTFLSETFVISTLLRPCPSFYDSNRTVVSYWRKSVLANNFQENYPVIMWLYS